MKTFSELISKISVTETNVSKPNIQQAVPFFMIRNMEHSLKFYADGLGFEMKNKWKEGHHAKIVEDKLGEGVSICFQCEDALQLYHEFLLKGLHPEEPFVGNGLHSCARIAKTIA